MSQDIKINKLLEKYNLNKDEINKIYEVNKNLDLVLEEDVRERIDFLENLKLSKIEIKSIIISNAWILTESFQRIKFLEEDFETLGITKEEEKELLIKYPFALSINPINLDDKIEEEQHKGKSNDEIKEDIIENYAEYFHI